MRYEVNYIEQYQEEAEKWEKLKNIPLSSEELKTMKKFELIKMLVDVRASQFEKKANTEKRNRLEKKIYPAICKIAALQGGHVILDIDELAYWANLTYIGKDLMLDDPDGIGGLPDLIESMSAAELCNLSTVNGFIKIEMLFCLYDKVQVADYTDEIMEIQQKIFCHKSDQTREQPC